MTDAVRPPKTTRHLDQLNALVRGEIPRPPIADLIGITLVQVELGRSVAEMNAEKRHANPMGTLHGGIICDLADLACGTAMASTLEDDESFTTLDLTTKFFKPVWSSKIRATARVIKRTRTTGFLECEVTDETGSLIAKVFSSCMALRGDTAKGR